MTAPARVFVSAGSNLEPRANLEAACAALNQRYRDLKISPVYESPAEGFDGPPFLNLVASFVTKEPPREVLSALAELETQAGRDRSTGKFSSRTLDLDLLLHGNTVDAILKLPHPDITRYAFVLRPLTDLVPDLTHPVTGVTIAEHWSAFPGPHQLTSVHPLNLSAAVPPKPRLS